MPKKTAKGELRVVALADMHEIPGPNPNVMGPEQEAQLRASIKAHGYREAITLVVRDGGGYWISNGVHRRNALLELGYVEVPCLVKEGDEETVRAERLALNRIHGQVDLSLAAADLRVLEAGGFDVSSEHLSLGLSHDELGVLLRAVEAASDAGILDDALEAGPAAEGGASAPKRYTLNMTFDRKEERDALRASLLKLGPSVEEGLRSLLGRGTPS